jgi:hypothetical protein
MQGDGQDDAVAGFAENAELVRRDAPAIDIDTPPHALEHIGRRPESRQDVIFLFEPEARVHDPVGEIAVIGQQQQPFRIPVEPADRVEALLRLDQFHHGLAVTLVARGGDVPPRLVEHDVPAALRADDLAIDPNFVSVWIGFGAQLGDGLAIHRDTARDDHLLSDAT